MDLGVCSPVLDGGGLASNKVRHAARPLRPGGGTGVRT